MRGSRLEAKITFVCSLVPGFEEKPCSVLYFAWNRHGTERQARLKCMRLISLDGNEG